MMQVSSEKRQNAWGCQGSPMDHRVTRNLLLLARVVLIVMLMVFSISSRNASAQDTQHQGIAAGPMPQSLQEKMHRLSDVSQNETVG